MIQDTDQTMLLSHDLTLHTKANFEDVLERSACALLVCFTAIMFHAMCLITKLK